MAPGVVTPLGSVLTARGIAAVDRGTGAVRGIEVDHGVVMPRGIVLTAHGIAAGVHGTGAVRGTEVAHGVVTPRGIVLTARGIVLTARGTTVADVAVASAHSTGRHHFPCQVFAWWGAKPQRQLRVDSTSSYFPSADVPAWPEALGIGVSLLTLNTGRFCIGILCD